ncbi:MULTISPECIES: aminoglycoside phosphotransferase [unclassified Pseudomonas]|uniref:aminoglycoside phosphotransferase n=1 Tax=unclassified Pseudomonas TaxID=196821 RepID=UPI000C88B282|nr:MULTISPECIES: aminoglycoside phosphotransferase [unclassified Pseudomonas]PMZ85271.1 aminoglycoside phosphotransferase [Pseudomonas sp. FW215-T2]PNA08308.1 aminoglycoside phosphotransferase [Pseudomonas sp. FW215-R3]PNB34436.1 aminoglycoside phosphotransferase [Pseudomonas sp. FW305-131]
MLLIQNLDLPEDTAAVINILQHLIDLQEDYPTKVKMADKAWTSRNSNALKKAAFRSIRATLAKMCVGSVRCSYCEDSLADEVEHILPKSLFPEQAFQWQNYLFACGPCNGPKSNRYGVILNNSVSEFIRKKDDLIVPPPGGQSALINPRIEDPTLFLELDLGGVTPDGTVLDATYEFIVHDGLSATDQARAKFSILVLGLNREVIRAARENAFSGFRARLKEYVDARQQNASQAELSILKQAILNTPHLTVFFEMRRQRGWLPQINHLFSSAPEAIDWQTH